MPKVKTKSNAKKKFKVTGTGLLKRKHAFKNHNLDKKSTKAKRALTHMGLVHPSDARRVNKMLNL
jgi:large subunit ribosomal protein L35